MNKKIVSWEEYCILVKSLANQIKPEIGQFDQLLCLARGGMLLGDAFSRIFNLPLAVMFTSSYRLAAKQGSLYIDDKIAKQTNDMGKKVLLLDDLVDSGVTMKNVVEHLKSQYELSLIKTATLWCKETSVYVPDYFVEKTDETWIVQPFEIFENEY